jgi:outer membrane protein assembly factor BamD
MLAMLDQFMVTYPVSKQMDYALYLKGYIYYKNDNGLLSRFTHQDLSERDPKGLKEAYKAFYELVTKYPNSKFKVDAEDKLNKLVTALARGEVYKARYYMNIKAYMAAINRAQVVIENYSHTTFVEEALAIQISAYKRLGQVTLSEQTFKVLKLNFPKSIYLAKPWEYQDMAWYAFWR